MEKQYRRRKAGPLGGIYFLPQSWEAVRARCSRSASWMTVCGSALAVVLGCFNSAAFAQLKMDEAIGLAVSHHPQLRMAEATVQRERGVLFQRSRKPNPIAGYTASDIGNEGQAGQQGVYLSQRIPRGGKIPLDMEVQRWEVTAARAKTQRTRCLVENSVGLQFVSAAFAQRRLAILESYTADLDATLQETAGLVKAQELSKSTLLQVSLLSKRLAVQLRQQRRAGFAARWRLGVLVGVGAAPDRVDDAVLNYSIEPLEFDATWHDLRQRSPDLQIAEAAHQKSLWFVKRQDAEPTPDLRTQLSIQHDTITHSPIVGLQMGVEVPVHDRNRGNRAAARADTQRTHHQRAALAMQLQTRLGAVLRSYHQGLERLRGNQELTEAAEENLTAMRSAFKNQQASTLELLSSKQAAYDLQLEALEAQRDIAVSLIQIHTCLVQ